MSQDEEVLAALKALAAADAGQEAPPEVEQRLQFAFRRRHRRPMWKWAIAAAAAVVAAAAIAAALYRPQRPEPLRVIIDPPKVVQPVREMEATPQPLRKVARNSPRRERREVVTDFFPLMDVAPPLDRAELVRVSLPASAMRTVGLPVREDHLSDRVQADVLVSEEGLATAIRFVKYQ